MTRLWLVSCLSCSVLVASACADDPVETDGQEGTGDTDTDDGGDSDTDGGTGEDGGDDGDSGSTGGADGGTTDSQDGGSTGSQDSGSTETQDSGSTTSGTPWCGNGVVDPGETCDDGNDDETDDCTTLCEPPSCDDDLVSGDESDEDCGGSCEPCVAGQACFENGDCETVACIDDWCADGLIPVDCSEEGNLYSTNSGTNTSVTWINISGEVRKTFWLDYQGERVLYDTIQPDGEETQNTYPTHPWVITDADDNCVQIFIPADAPSDAYLS